MIIPPYLQKGDRVAIVATAKVVDRENTLYGISILEQWGLEVVVGQYVFEKYFQFAGTDEQRRDDLQVVINDPQIKAIFMVRGGYGSSRIVDQIDFTPLLSNPKWICGFSDITIFNNHLYNLGICSFHAPMPSFFHALENDSLGWFKSLIFGAKEILHVQSHTLNRSGTASGKLIGGNLSIICNTIGTESEIRTEENLLFIEDVGENLYHIDRMIVQLRRAGFLDNLAGLIVGQFSDMKDNADSFGFSAEEIVLSHVSQFNFPLAFNFPVGHTNKNYALPIGAAAKLTVEAESVQLKIS